MKRPKGQLVVGWRGFRSEEGPPGGPSSLALQLGPDQSKWLVQVRKPRSPQHHIKT